MENAMTPSDTPASSDWVEWSGGENPVPGKMVDLMFASDNWCHAGISDAYNWKHGRGAGFDIIAYRLADTPASAVKGEAAAFMDAEARAEAWSDRVEIQEMISVTSAVFAKWASPKLLSRFRQQMAAVVQQAFIEGISNEADRLAALQPHSTQQAGYGWLFQSDDGREWSLSHPIESGESQYAEDIEPATGPRLVEELQSAWRDLAEKPSQQAGTEVTDAMIDAAAEVMWNDRDARMGGSWSSRDPREVCVIQTRATARAAILAALTSEAKA